MSTAARTPATPGFDRRAIPAQALESRWHAADGWALRRIDWAPPTAARGSLLFMPGRGDCYEKYLETLDSWHRAGWGVTALDWRGQAGSGRLGTDALTGHIDDFGTWTADLARFWGEWTAATPGPHVIVGHSMGGHLVLRALAERGVRPDAAVLSAPMLGFVPGWLPLAPQHLFGRLMCAIGDPRRPAWETGEKPGAKLALRAQLLTHDGHRYADELWWRKARPELEMGAASWGWLERAAASMQWLERPGCLENVAVPVLVLAARDDGLVSWPAIRRAARRLPLAELKIWGPEARHELLREVDLVRDAVLAAVAQFLNRAAPPPTA